MSRRRAWIVEQKRAVLLDALAWGGSVCAAMERHEVTSGLLYTWRRSAMAGLLINLPNRVRLSVDASFDAEALGRVLAVLGR